MTRAVLSIGSNEGDRLATLQGAVNVFRPWLVAVSPVFVTAPWGPIPQDDFLNAVMIVADDSCDAAGWLRRAQAAEQRAGRVRLVRWGPRTLDVDLVVVDDVVSADPVLTLPHPRAHERAFVLVPWLAVDPLAQLSETPVSTWISRLAADEVSGVQLAPEHLLA